MGGTGRTTTGLAGAPSSAPAGAMGVAGAGAQDPFGGLGDPTCGGTCNGVCLFGVCLGGGAPTMPTMPTTPPPSVDAGSAAPGTPGATCSAGDDCDSNVCFFGSCRAPRCGDRVCNGDEDAKSCTMDCPTHCGDGVVSGSEECNDGNTMTERCAYGMTKCTVCDESCHNVDGATSYCGDAVIATADGESCEDGNATAGDGCDEHCQVEARASCGNDTLDADEQCEDSNTDNLDGCNAGCEQCDDGNAVTESCAYGEMSCNVCDASCRMVRGATSYCGDGVVDSANGESCDDGNTVASDGCSAICQKES